eukprot:symbB.v1.2.030400.t1/scaffold3420.1/size57189/8
MSPGVLIFPRDSAKLQEVREQSLWAFFARKFDNSLESSQLKVGGSQMSLISFGGGMLRGLSGQAVQSKCSQNVDKRQSPSSWSTFSCKKIGLQSSLKHGPVGLAQVLASSLADVIVTERLERNPEQLFHAQTLRIHLANAKKPILVREKLAKPRGSNPLLALRVGCDWNKTDLVFDGDVSAVSASSTGSHGCAGVWAIIHWQMSKKPVSEELLLVWIDPGGTPLQHAPIRISENSVLLWHRYTGTTILTQGQWKLEVQSIHGGVLARRSFFVYREPSQIPWERVKEYFDIVALLNQQYLLLRGDMLYLKHEMDVCKNWVQQSVRTALQSQF